MSVRPPSAAPLACPLRARRAPALVGRLLAVVALGASAGAAAGQAPAGQAPPPPVLAVTVDVRDIMPDDVRDVPGATAVLTDADLLALRPFSVHDAFDVIPGVFTIDDDAAGRRAGIGVRAAPSRRSRKTLLLEDGTPINASTYLDPSAHYTPPLDRLERIEVLKGAGQVVHGPLNNHGVINFRNKRPTVRPETVADVGVGTQDTWRRHLLHRNTYGPLGLVLSYTGLDTNGVFDIERHRFDDGFANLRWRTTPRREVSVAATYFRERSQYDESNLTPLEFEAAPRTKRDGQQHNLLAVNLLKVDAVHEWQTDGGVDHVTKLFVTDMDRPRFAVDLGASPIALLPRVEPEVPFVEGTAGVMVGRLRHYRTGGVEHRVRRDRVRLLGREHAVQWGLRGEWHGLDDRRSIGGIGQVLAPDARGGLVRDHNYGATAASTFIQDVVRLGPLVVTSGVRLEHYRQHKTRRPSEDEGTGRPRESDARTLVLPSVNVMFDGWKRTRLFASVGRGYTPAFARTAAGFPLLPETGVTAQVGLRSYDLGGVTFEGAGFVNRITDTVVQLPFTIDDQNLFVNSEDSRSYGAEVAAGLHSARWTGSRANLFVRGAYTWMRAQFTGGTINGRDVPEIPRHTGSVTSGVEHVSGWHLSATVSWVGRFTTDLANTRGGLVLADEDGVPLGPDDTFDLRETIVLGEVPRHALVAARLNVPLAGSRLSFWMQGRNLADRLYITDLTNGLRPGARRTVTAGLRATF